MCWKGSATKFMKQKESGSVRPLSQNPRPTGVWGFGFGAVHFHECLYQEWDTWTKQWQCSYVTVWLFEIIVYGQIQKTSLTLLLHIVMTTNTPNGSQLHEIMDIPVSKCTLCMSTNGQRASLESTQHGTMNTCTKSSTLSKDYFTSPQCCRGSQNRLYVWDYKSLRDSSDG